MIIGMLSSSYGYHLTIIFSSQLLNCHCLSFYLEKKMLSLFLCDWERYEFQEQAISFVRGLYAHKYMTFLLAVVLNKKVIFNLKDLLMTKSECWRTVMVYPVLSYRIPVCFQAQTAITTSQPQLQRRSQSNW